MRAAALVLAASAPLVAGLASLRAEDGDNTEARLVDDGRDHTLRDVSGNDCLRCHETIGAEWRVSTHATAWQDARYQAAVAKTRRPRGCWGCHVPEPLSTGDLAERPEPRDENRHLGVDCRTCHLGADGETVLGPLGIATDAHPTQRSELFQRNTDSALCITCHRTTIGPVIGVAKDFVDTDQRGLGLSCVECHMPSVKRAIANDEAGSSEAGATEYAERLGRSHRIMTPRDPVFLRRAFLLSAESEAGRTVLRIDNQAGHRVPGLVDRKLTFRARVVDAEGTPLGEGELTLDSRSYLPVDDGVELVVEARGARLELTAIHDAPGFAEPVVFLERAFDLK